MDQIEEIKGKTDIVSLISEYIDLKKSGKNYKALCPFHSEKTPSFMVSPELQIFKCFGCSRGGDVFTFLEEYEGMDFYEALKFLANRVGVKLKPLKEGQKGEKEKFYEINSLASYFYHYVLVKHPAGRVALSYLTRERGVKMDTIETFQLGFAPDSPLALKKYLVDKKKYSFEDLERAGLVYRHDKDIVDRFSGRVIFPLQDHRGNIVGFAGRVLPSEKKDVAKYINSPETPVYQKSKVLYGLNITKGDIKIQKKAVIVEGELDLISSWQVGLKNVVAIKGSALTQDQIKLLSRFTDSIVLAMDADLAGDEAVRRGIEIAQKEGFEIKVAKLSGFKDPDEAAKINPEKLFEAVEGAVGVWDFMIDSVFFRNQGNLDRISKAIVPILFGISDRILQAHYVKKVSERLGIPVEAVSEQIRSIKVEAQAPRLKVEAVAKPKIKPRQELLEERLLAVAFRYDSRVLAKKEIRSLLVTPLAKRIVEKYKVFYQRHKSFDPSLFAGELSAELVGGFTDMVLKDIKGIEVETPERLKKELNILVHELKILKLKKRLSDLGKKIRELESSKKKDELTQTQKEFLELTKSLHQLETGDFKSII